MPADNEITMTGWIVSRDAEAGPPPRPGKFRMSTYCSGSKAKDNIAKAFITVKQFDMDIRRLVNGTKVRVVGRLDPWQTKEGQQVIDVMAETVDVIDVDGNEVHRNSPAFGKPAPAVVAAVEEEY
jgi:hypothetical protein